MDPEANIKEQKRIATEILKIRDNSDGQGDFTAEQLELLADLAERLAELVLALIEWKAKGGF